MPGTRPPYSGIKPASQNWAQPACPSACFLVRPAMLPMVALEPCAALLVVSRGIVEGKRRSDEYGLERVKDGVQRTTAASAKELCVGILDGVQQFMRTPPTHNDVTALALLRKNGMNS